MKPKPIIIDISEWQEPWKINYPQLARAIDGVIIRVQYGSLYIDKHYKTHIKRFKELGVPVAVYAWVRGTSNSDMAQEAKDFWERVQFYKPDFWWLDVEEQSMADMRGGCEIYLQTLKQLGAKKVGAYIANHLYQKFNLDTAKFDGIWIPSYGANTGQFQGEVPTATAHYDVHQYTSEGRLPGYAGLLDLNRLTGRKSFEYFFGSKISSQPPIAGGMIIMKQIILKQPISLRKEAKQTAIEIAQLKTGDIIKFNDIIVNDGQLWGVQPRNDGTKGYLPLGKIESYGEIK